MNIFKYRWKIFVCSFVFEFCRWYMGHVREFWVLVACEKRNTKCTRTCACAQTLRMHCYWRAQCDNCSHKKAKDFQRNESRERQSDLLFVSFSR